jgi:hypothetical protein
MTVSGFHWYWEHFDTLPEMVKRMEVVNEEYRHPCFHIQKSADVRTGNQRWFMAYEIYIKEDYFTVPGTDVVLPAIAAHGCEDSVMRAMSNAIAYRYQWSFMVYTKDDGTKLLELQQAYPDCIFYEIPSGIGEQTMLIVYDYGRNWPGIMFETFLKAVKGASIWR